MPKALTAHLDEDDMFDLAEERSLPRRRKPVPWLRMAFLSSLAIAALAYFAREDEPDESGAPKGLTPSVLIAPAPVWKPIPASPALYALDKSLGPATAEARQHTSGGREDTLTLGTFGEARHARIALIQGFSEPARSFFVDLARRAAEAGLSVARNTQSRMVATKFGPVETAAVTLVGATEQSCQAFRFADASNNFGFHGWLCGAAAPTADDVQLACFVDRITLTNGDYSTLKALFARAERSRLEVCSPAAKTASIGVKNRP
ncbi:hypothetical protein [Microvirga terricola]|uniref:Uncharacterized protein n=1 Tax=Microvirga terricola TaxID=2719797 RepID=A0ABX0V6I3_9HYPH|nr:hypothetical protein [Microvirga terricola]NIX75444.1 hypothetical protein [Microvirga terricola]